MPLPPLLAAAGDLVLPRACAGCGAAGELEAGRLLCHACAARLSGLPVLAVSAGGVPTRAGARYEGAVRAAVLAFKDRGATALSAPLGGALAAAVAAALAVQPDPPARVVLVPVPATRRSRRRRGHDPVGSLAIAAADVLTAAGLPASPAPLLRVARRVGDQRRFGVLGRRRNVVGAFSVRRGARLGALTGAVVVVDDVVTTGATLTEAVRALRAGGGCVRAAAAVAATPLRRRR